MLPTLGPARNDDPDIDSTEDAKERAFCPAVVNILFNRNGCESHAATSVLKFQSYLFEVLRLTRYASGLTTTESYPKGLNPIRSVR
jgi:hypothetical protein